MNNVRISHSSLASYRSCPQMFKYSYVDNITSTNDKWAMVKDLGSAVHYGIERAISSLAFDPRLADDVNALVDIAKESSQAWVRNNTEAGRKNFHGEPDLDYYASMSYINETAPQVLELHLPLLKLGTRYRPVWASELGLELRDCDECEEGSQYEDFPMVEYNFSIEDVVMRDGVEETRTIEGIVDAVLYDMQNEVYVLFDWKCRGHMLDEMQVAMDSQMMLYATVLNQLITTEVQIHNVVMYQMLNKLPKPAKLNKDGKPSIAPAFSTWDFWWNSIPEPTRNKLDMAEWYNLMTEPNDAGKTRLHGIEEWVIAVEIPVTTPAMQEVSANTELTIDNIQRSLDNNTWQKRWSAHGCQMCEYKKLCLATRYGADINETIKLGYVTKE